MLLPELGEQRRFGFEALDQVLPGRLGDVLGHRRPERRDHPRDIRFPVQQTFAPFGVEQALNQGVAVLERDRVDVAHQPGVAAVVREDVAACVADRDRIRLQLVEDQLHGRGDDLAVLVAFRRGRTGEAEKVGVLVLVEAQRARDGLQDLLGRVDVAALLEPRVPGDADSGELRDLLAAQPRRPAPPDQRQADLLGRDPRATAAQEVRQLMAADLRFDGRGHATRMTRDRTWYQVVRIPG